MRLTVTSLEDRSVLRPQPDPLGPANDLAGPARDVCREVSGRSLFRPIHVTADRTRPGATGDIGRCGARRATTRGPGRTCAPPRSCTPNSSAETGRPPAAPAA